MIARRAKLSTYYTWLASSVQISSGGPTLVDKNTTKYKYKLADLHWPTTDHEGIPHLFKIARQLTAKRTVHTIPTASNRLIPANDATLVKRTYIFMSLKPNGPKCTQIRWHYPHRSHETLSNLEHLFEFHRNITRSTQVENVGLFRTTGGKTYKRRMYDI